MRNLPIEQLRAFVMVADEGGVTAAATLLGRTQPAVSQQIKKLERLLGESLFNREGARLVLTPAGHTLNDYARRILSLNDEAFAAFEKPSVSGRLRLGIPSEFAVALLPKIVSRFAKTYPDVTLEVTCDLSRNLTSEQQRDRYDLVLSLHDRVASNSKGYLQTDELVWVGAPNRLVQLEEAVPLIAAPDGCIYRQRALRQLERVGKPCRIVYTIPDLSGIQTAIEEGLGVTVLARSTVPPGLVELRDSRLPALGEMGIRLVKQASGNNQAVALLADSIAAGLQRANA